MEEVPDLPHNEVTTVLKHSPKTDTILLGYSIGHADTKAGRLELIASGRTIRFSLEGEPGYVDLDLNELAGEALDMILLNRALRGDEHREEAGLA
jgi:hypothetical protein